MDCTFFFTVKEKCKSLQQDIDIQCIYFDDRNEISCLEFFSEMERAVKSNKVYPDCVAIIATPSLSDKLYQFWQSEKEQRDNYLERGLPYIKGHYFYKWSPDKVTLSANSIQPFFEIPAEKLIDYGLRHLVTKNNVVQIAPAGHSFKHPSGNINKLFIQARELAFNEPELCFASKAICLSLGNSTFKDISVVYIDTMSIYPFVREALSFVGCDARICSFHSYEEATSLSLPESGSYVIVISASTSGGMAKKFKSRGFDKNRIITLLDISSNDRTGKVLIELEKIDNKYEKLTADGNETEIEIVGEHFSSKAKPPRAVTIGKPHTPKNLPRILKQFGLTGFAPFFFNNQGVSSRNLLHISSQSVLENNDFKLWLKEELKWNVSLAIDHIVHTNDEASKEIALLTALDIKSLKNATLPPKVISYNDLNQESIKDAHGILIISALASDGGVFREISRDLREYEPTPNLPRHFLVGLGLPQSSESWLRLKQFLERNATERKYGFSEWLVLPLGPDNQRSYWDSLAKLASSAQVVNLERQGLDQEIIEQSLEQFADAITENHNSFLPKANSEHFKLTEGFVFFGDIFKEDELGNVPKTTTFLAITSALQAARELQDVKNQLKPTGYESVVLSPECFLRFNDDILQACLLRSALPSELDYSASPHYSRLMKEFLIKVFERQLQSYGAASLEFAVAFATGQLKLNKSDQTDVISSAIDSCKQAPSSLLGALLMANYLSC
jgi:hypothetical protein